jgi:glycine cleavage system aminomethyltransferase T
MAYVPAALAERGTRIDIDIRGRVTQAHVVPMPFYSRSRPDHGFRAPNRGA